MLKTLWRTLLLVLLGPLVILAMWGYVRLTQHHPAPDEPLRVTVSRDIVFPWQQADLRVDYSGAVGEVSPVQAPPPATLLFLLDTSGSMSDKLDQEKQAILEMQRNLSARGQPLRVGVMEFADTARIISPFTSDMNQLATTLQTMQPAAGGGTTFLAGLTEALVMLDAAGGTGALIMLTDGGAGETPATLAEFFQKRWKPSGHELYLVGVGADAVNPASFTALTDDPSRYIITAADTGIIDLLFQEVALRMGNGVGRNASLHLPLAEPLWDWGTSAPAADPVAPRTALTPRAQDPLEARIGALFARPYQWALPLAPKLGGILPTLHAPPTLKYFSMDGKVFSVRPAAAGVPKVMVVTWLLLFMLMLPALLYLLAQLISRLFRETGEMPELEPVPWTPERRPPPNLPPRSVPDSERVRWAPTLVLGLGHTGRVVLTQVRQAIGDSLDQAQSRPVLLALDLARDEVPNGAGEAVPGCLHTLAPEQVCILPIAATTLTETVRRQPERARQDPDGPWAGLDLTPFEALGADALRLAGGSAGRAPLARAALLNDLEQGEASALLARLGGALEAWRRISPDQGNRQIVLVANVQGGVGAGWLTDLVILLRRLVAADEAAGRAVEINLLLVGDEQPGRGGVPLAAPTLFAELDRLAGAGSRPFRHRLAPLPTGASAPPPGTPAAVLDGWVRRRPQDGVFVLPLPARRTPGAEAFAGAADAITLLIDQQRRGELTYRLETLKGAESRLRAAGGREVYTQLAIHHAVFPRSFFRALLLARLTGLLGRQVLFPELEHLGGREVLKPRPFEGRTLCQTDARADPLGVGAVLTEAALGRCAGLQSMSLEREVLAEAANAIRLAAITQGNLALRSRGVGLLGLAETAGALAQHLTECAGRLGNPQAILDLAQAFAAVRSQALTWIELFFGSRALVDQGLSPVLTGQPGLLVERCGDLTTLTEALAAWGRGASRVLVAPLTAADLADPVACDRKLDRMLHALLGDWLGSASDPLGELVARCHWELTAPGADGAPVGVNLVVRGTQTRRYAPRPDQLAQFESDLQAELGPLLDLSADFHILALLHAMLDPDDDRALVRFVERLKGPLRGERASLLATVPTLPPGSPLTLTDLRTRLVKTLKDLTVTAAEQVDPIPVGDRNRISVLQTLPLLCSAPDAAAGDPIHRPERLLRHEANRLAAALHRQSVDLPPVIAVALEDRPRLRQFARLYVNGQIGRHPLDGVWSVRGVAGEPRLAAVPGQSLADAAACYVTRGLDLTPASAPLGTPEPDDAADDFAAYLRWLANQD